MFGIVNVLGNVEEWTESLAVQTESPGEWVAQGGLRVTKGGSWRLPADVYTLSLRGSVPNDVADVGLGFRCAKSDWPR